MRHYSLLHTVPHQISDFDAMTEHDRRSITQRHYEYWHWCKHTAMGAYFLDHTFDPEGINVSFDLEQDYERFLIYTNDNWIHLHD
jgi:hypothetical protein